MNNMKIAIAVSGILFYVTSAQASILTFVIDGLNNFDLMPQGYGDRITSLDNGGFHYGEAGEGFTPNVTVTYTETSGQEPSWWGAGFGDLDGVYFDDVDWNGQGEIVLTADYGFEVVLYGFDLGALTATFNADPNVNSVQVSGCARVPLFEQLNVSVPRFTHLSYDFSAQPLRARELRIRFDSSNLTVASDNIGLDNIRFGQAAVGPEDIACPADFATPVCELNFFDVSAFLSLYNSMDPLADLNGDGDHNFFDVSIFLSEYSAGCDAD